MNLLSLNNSETLTILTKFCNQKPSKYRNLVKICNELVKKVKKYGFSNWTQGGQIEFLQGAKSILEKSQRAKRKFWGQQMLFGNKFLKFGPKRANLATLHTAKRAVYTYVHTLIKSKLTISCATASVERCLSRWRCYKYTCEITEEKND